MHLMMGVGISPMPGCRCGRTVGGMNISRTFAAAACTLGATVCAGCGAGTAGSSGAHVSTQRTTGAHSGPCGGDRPIVYLEGAVCADGTPFSKDKTNGIGNAWSPDGSTDAYVTPSGRKIVLRSASNGQERTLFSVPRKFGIVDRLAWSPDGSRLALILLDERGFSAVSVGGAIGAYHSHLLVIDSNSGHPLRDALLTPSIVNMPFITNPPDALAFSPDGAKVLVSWDSPVVVDVASGRVERLWHSPAVAAWSPSGDVLFLDVVGRQRFGALHVWSPGGSTRVLWPQAKLTSLGISAEHGIEYGQMRASPDGTKLAIRTTDGNRTAVSVFALDGSSVGAKAGTYPLNGSIWDFDWSPDSTRIAAVVLNGSTLNVQLLDTASGTWKAIADVPINVPDSDTLDALAPVKKLTWSN
jgi:WD40 repeat protein